MEPVIRHLYGGQMSCYMLSYDEKIELYERFRKYFMIDYPNLEDEVFLQPVRAMNIRDANSLVWTMKLFEYTLLQNLEVSSRIADHLAQKCLSSIVKIVEKDNINLDERIVIALAASPEADNIGKFRLVQFFKNTTFAKNPTPEFKLDSFGIEELENDVLPSGLFDEKTVLLKIIQWQKEILNECYDSE